MNADALFDVGIPIFNMLVMVWLCFVMRQIANTRDRWRDLAKQQRTKVWAMQCLLLVMANDAMTEEAFLDADIHDADDRRDRKAEMLQACLNSRTLTRRPDGKIMVGPTLFIDGADSTYFTERAKRFMQRIG